MAFFKLALKLYSPSDLTSFLLNIIKNKAIQHFFPSNYSLLIAKKTFKSQEFTDRMLDIDLKTIKTIIKYRIH